MTCTWSAEDKLRLLTRYGASESHSRQQRLANLNISRAALNMSRHAAFLENQGVRDSATIEVAGRLGEGYYGSVFILKHADGKVAIKLEELNSKRPNDLSRRSEFYESAALAIEMGRADVGPKCTWSDPFIAKTVAVRFTDGRDRLFPPASPAGHMGVGVLFMEAFSSDLSTYFESHGAGVFFRERANIEKQLSDCMRNLIQLGVVCSDIKP